MSRSLNTSTYLIEDSSKFWSDTNITEDDSIVVGDHIAATGGLVAEQGTGEGEGDQERSVHHRGGQGLVDVVPVASHDHLQLLHLGFNVVVPNQSKHIAVINPPSLELSVLILGSRGRHQDILVSGGS